MADMQCMHSHSALPAFLPSPLSVHVFSLFMREEIRHQDTDSLIHEEQHFPLQVELGLMCRRCLDGVFCVYYTSCINGVRRWRCENRWSNACISPVLPKRTQRSNTQHVHEYAIHNTLHMLLGGPFWS
jgi:hypothetical protein